MSSISGKSFGVIIVSTFSSNKMLKMHDVIDSANPNQPINKPVVYKSKQKNFCNIFSLLTTDRFQFTGSFDFCRKKRKYSSSSCLFLVSHTPTKKIAAQLKIQKNIEEKNKMH